MSPMARSVTCDHSFKPEGAIVMRIELPILLIFLYGTLVASIKKIPSQPSNLLHRQFRIFCIDMYRRHNSFAFQVAVHISHLFELEGLDPTITIWMYTWRKCIADAVEECRSSSKADDPTSMIDINGCLGNPCRMICSNQARNAEDCGANPASDSLQIPTFGVVVQRTRRWVEE